MFLAAEGSSSIEVNSGALHRRVGGYPGNHRMPICCSVMRTVMKPGDEIIASPLKGDDADGASLTIRYVLPRRAGWLKALGNKLVKFIR